MNYQKVNLGKIGEQKAVEYLQGKGFKILEQNFRSKFGEIDIVAQKNEFLVFVEVKTRWSKAFGLPEEAIFPSKIRSIIKTGRYFKLLHPQTPDLMRIDVVAIELNSSGKLKRLRHFENVTG